MPPFVDTFRALPTRSKAIIAVSAVAILAIAFLMFRIAGAPSYTMLTSGLDPAKTGEITAALDEQGIAYELRNNGTGLAVDKSQAAQARVALAGAGVNVSSAGEGFELFDEQKLGASEMQQKVTYQRALEGEIARTIGNVEGVSNPQVQLVLPEDDLFADEATPATAAVMLGNSADSMDPSAMRGIAQLVASSVKGLKTDNVTITDASGTLLWPQGDGAGGGGMVAGKQALEARYSRALEADLNALLVRTLGPGKGQVSVTADLNADKTTQDEVTYDKGGGVPLKEQTESEKLQGGGSTTGGTAGTGSNIPTYSAGAGANGANSNYQRKTENTEYGVDKKVARTEVAPGRRQQAARRPAGRQVRAAVRLRRAQDGRHQRRRHRHRARRRDAGRPGAVRQGGDAEGRPGPDDAARPAQVGRHRLRHAALPLLHEPLAAQARVRGHGHARLADLDRGARLAGRARAADADHGAGSRTRPSRCRRGRPTPTCRRSTS